MTDKQKAFVAEYLIDLNATQAAIRAGYSEKTAYAQASRLLTNVEVQEAVAQSKAERSKRTEITQDRVLQELARIGFADIRKAVKWGVKPEASGEFYPVELIASEDVDDDTAAAITEVSLTNAGVKLKMADKQAALTTMLKHLAGDPDEDDAPTLDINVTTSEAKADVRVTRSNG